MLSMSTEAFSRTSSGEMLNYIATDVEKLHVVVVLSSKFICLSTLHSYNYVFEYETLNYPHSHFRRITVPHTWR